MAKKSILQILLDNLPELKHKAPNFLDYSSRVKLDNVMFNIQYAAFPILTLKKAGKGRHPEWIINFKKRTITNDVNGVGITHWSFNNEVQYGDYVTSEKIKAACVYSVSDNQNKIGVIDLISVSSKYYTAQEFNEQFKAESKPIIECLENNYCEQNRKFQRATNKECRSMYQKEAERFNYCLINVRKHFNITSF